MPCCSLPIPFAGRQRAGADPGGGGGGGMGAPCPLPPSGLRFTARSAHVATPTQRTSLYEQGRIQRLKKGGAYI